jgi:sugar O-acyltransferase (sialic acid O-acetyltransferase NeuD family)
MVTRAAASQRVVIVGNGETAAIAHEAFSSDSPYEVVAFSADQAYVTTDQISDLPVVALDQLTARFAPDKFSAFVAVSMPGLNRVRRRLFDSVKAMGFTCVSYVSSRALIAPSASFGENVFIHANAILAYNAKIGDNVMIGAGTHIGHSSVVEGDCYFGPHATVCGFARIGRNTFIGAGSCVADNKTVAHDCVVGAGAVILRDTDPSQVYLGNPARPTGSYSSETFPAY